MYQTAVYILHLILPSYITLLNVNYYLTMFQANSGLDITESGWANNSAAATEIETETAENGKRAAADWRETRVSYEIDFHLSDTHSKTAVLV